MMRSSIVAWIILLAFSGGAAHAGDACRDLEQEIVGKKFVAKEPLYDTKIDLDGIVKLERDAEEIPKGATFTVAEVKCGSGRIKMELFQTRPKDEVEIFFLYSKVDRTHEDAMGNIKKMMAYVFEETSEQ